MAEKKRRLYKVAWFVSLLVLLWGVGFIVFYQEIQTLHSNIDLQRQTDAIVVLTGGKGRLEEGVTLLTHIHDEPGQLFISGVDKDVSVPQLLQRLNLKEVDVSCCIALGYEATNTRENAQETLDWMQHKGFQSLRLVTAHYHMPRSLREFRHVMPNLQIVAHPMIPPLFERTNAWARLQQWRSLLLEYSKYLLARARLQLIQWFPQLEHI